MNGDEPVLAELRKISAWTDMQRKMTKWSLIIVAVFIPAMILCVVWMEQQVKGSLEGADSGEAADWYDVDRSVRQGDLAEAIRIGERLIQKTPQYPEGHRRLAGAYLAAGNIREARQHYAEAFRLFPSEENGKMLAAIDKRNQAENPQPVSGAAPRASGGTP